MFLRTLNSLRVDSAARPKGACGMSVVQEEGSVGRLLPPLGQKDDIIVLPLAFC